MRHRLLTLQERCALGKSYLSCFPGLVSGNKNPIHLSYTADLIQQAINKKTEKLQMLLISMPPRHGKTELISKHAVPWIEGKFPRKRIILTSYSAELSDSNSDVAKNIFEKWGEPLFDTKPSKSMFNRAAWDTHLGGGVISAGVGGSITGFGADVFIIDDYVKDAEQAESRLIREKLWNWWQAVAATRLHPSAVIIIIACLTGDTKITMGNGSWKYIKDIKIGDEVLSYSNNKITKNKILNFIKHTKDIVYEIKTPNTIIKANKRHPFLTEDKKGERHYKKTKDLCKGDYLIGLNKNNLFNNNTLSTKEAWLLGFMFGDGWLTYRNAKNFDKKRNKHYPRKGIITCVAKGEHRYLNNQVIQYFKNIFGIIIKETKFGYYRTEKQLVGEYFKEKGLLGTAKTKRIPKYIFSENEKNRLSFLNGFIDADGWIIRSKKGYIGFGIKICNKKLLEDIKLLATSLGYKVSNIYERKIANKPPHSKKLITSKNYTISFSTKIDNSSFKKQMITKITQLEPECVYDVQVENSENFIANGIVSHNTRWHDDDLIGRLLKQQASEKEDFPFEVTYINFPAISEEEDVLGRKPGEALWPWRYNKQRLLNIKKTVGSFWWNALYQGSPVDRGGTLFKKKSFRYYERCSKTGDFLCFLPGYAEPIRISKKSLLKRVYADPALEVKLKNDPSGALAWAYCRKHKFWLLLDRINDRIEHTEILQTFLNFAFKNNCSSIGIENEKIGKIIVKQSAGKDRVGGVPIPFKEVACGKLDKYARATPMASYIENQRVFFPKNAPWLADFEDHLIKFPNRTEHDEDADCTAYAQDMEETMSVAEALGNRR